MKMLRKILMGIVGVALLFSTAFAVEPYPYRTPKNDANGQEIIVLMGMLAQDGYKILGVVDDIFGNYMLWVEIDGVCRTYLLQVNPKTVIPMTCAQGLIVFENSVNAGYIIDPRGIPISYKFGGYGVGGCGVGGYGGFGDIGGIGPICGKKGNVWPD